MTDAPQVGQSGSVHFRVCARDPDGTFEACSWRGPTYPQIGDTLMLPDGSPDGQDVPVLERVFYPGTVEVWVGGFDGWDNGSVTAMFDLMRGGSEPSDV